MESRQYALIEANTLQGDLYLIKEIALFSTLAEAQEYYEEHPEYRTKGHHWSGLTQYQLVKLNKEKRNSTGDEYEPLGDEKHVSFGNLGIPNPTIIRLERD